MGPHPALAAQGRGSCKVLEKDDVDESASPAEEDDDEILLSSVSISGGVGGMSLSIRRSKTAFGEVEGIDDLLAIESVGMSSILIV